MKVKDGQKMQSWSKLASYLAHGGGMFLRNIGRFSLDYAASVISQTIAFFITTSSRKRFGIGHMYIYTFLLRMTDTVTSQNIDLPPGTPCIASDEGMAD
jgi:hypothetical protein